MERRPLVGIVMGSPTDSETMLAAKSVLDEFDIRAEVRIMSAHRTPEEVSIWARGAAAKGLQVIIAAAGLAAHLAGVVAAHTVLPVIGVPMDGGPLQGLDALLSTVQMPRGTPVATVAIGKAGAVNAALLAVRMLALHEPELQKKLESYQQKTAQSLLE
ncbi:MAG TPA: 5-(carboxyamino)imidazole ribonucleotide mutase, partial [Oligoflexia bacterium]|nr:5-(carboxyamino)imidazole ribonucleotide mutase [Oligoflexia bacterium]